MMKNPLLDKDFLYELDQVRHKEIYAKVIALDINENPIEEIEGRVTAGSINIDGTSAVRRACSLSLVAQEVNINDFYWGLTNKFKLMIGIKNQINSKYPDIIWFKLGLYVITSFSTSISTNNATINISGKDKMCLLNGDISGNLPSSVDFGSIESYDTVYTEVLFEDKSQYRANKYYIFVKKDENDKMIYELATGEYNQRLSYYSKEEITNIDKLTIKTIIRESIHTYAKEPYHNIIINDIENSGLELLEYRGDEEHPLYLIKRWIDKNTPIETDYLVGDINVVPNGDIKIKRNGTGNILTIANLRDDEYDSLVSDFNTSATKVSLVDGQSEQLYTVIKLQNHDTAGYRETALVYPDDLISNIGESLTSMLDKIKNMLGDFEYFYDLDGRFIFQRKKTYINTSWNTLVDTGEGVYAESAIGTSAAVYSFENNNLITAFQNTPVLNNLRNDFSVWGTRTTPTGVELPIHARYAIDKKPMFYKSLKTGQIYISEHYDFKDFYPDAIIRDWRELIYQMAVDYFQYHQEPSFLPRLIKANIAKRRNPHTGEIELFSYYPTGFTGYEIYYTDMQGFWRQLYNPEAKLEYTCLVDGHYETVREIVNEDTGEFKEYESWVDNVWSDNPYCDYYILDEGIDEKDKRLYWHKDVVENPQALNFWFDFLDNGDLQQFAVNVVGDRPKSINDKDITSIYFRDTPSIIYVDYDKEEVTDYDPGYTYAFISQGLENMFNISSQGKSAKDKIDEMLFNYAYCVENITITAIPVYYLEPNTRIFVHDEQTKINGEYLVSRITIPLTYNGTMSITATKAVERLY